MTHVSVPPRCSGYAPAVKVMTCDSYSEGNMIFFDDKFHDQIKFDNSTKRMRLDPRALIAHPLSAPSATENVRKLVLKADTAYMLGFVIDSVSTDNSEDYDYRAISVQTVGLITLAINKDKNPGTPIFFDDMVQTQKYKTELEGTTGDKKLIEDAEIGVIVGKFDKMPCDPPDFYRVRVRLDGGGVMTGA